MEGNGAVVVDGFDREAAPLSPRVLRSRFAIFGILPLLPCCVIPVFINLTNPVSKFNCFQHFFFVKTNCDKKC